MGRSSNTSQANALLLAAASALAITLAAPLPAAAQSAGGRAATTRIDLPAGPLGPALLALSEALGVNIIAADSLLGGKTAPAISGAYAAPDAIGLLLTGTGLKATRNSSGDYIVSQQVAVGGPGTRLASAQATSFAPAMTETFVVTGSRIARTAVNSPAPIDIVTADDIAKLGLTDTTEALRFVPALNQSLTLSTLGNFDIESSTLFGLSTLDLRGMGTNRTLVLVNGRRHVSGVANTATVDVASIPAALIDRVEVLTGGGSSIYGADAVSGVVNYVLKDDFEGVDARANVSLPTRGDGEAYYGALTVGGNFAGGRGNAVLNVEYNRQTQLRLGDREATRTSTLVWPNREGFGADPRFENIVVSNARNNIWAPDPVFTFAPSPLNNRFRVLDGETTFGGFPLSQIIDAETGNVRAYDFGNITGNTFIAQGGDGLSQEFSNPNAPSIPDIERYFINAFADYDVTDTITGFVEVKYARSQSAGALNYNLRVFSQPIARDNVFIPEVAQVQFDSLVDQGLDPQLTVARAWQDDLITPPAQTTRETFRIVGGFEGDISKALSYTISANFGRTETSVVNNAAPVLDRYYAATDAIADPVTGEPICRSDIDSDTLPGFSFPGLVSPGFRSFVPGDGSCVPLNVFGQRNVINPDAVAFVFQRSEDTSSIQQFVVNATITGNSEDFLNLPAGSVSYAAGFEYRDERSEFVPNTLDLNQLDLFQFGVPPIIDGGFDVVEGFAEVNIPILADLPFAKQLTIDASVRVADYSTVGGATSFAFGTVWQPVSDIRLRASFNRAIRAPNISELLVPQSVSASALQPGEDPCDPVGLAEGSDTRRANCALLVPDLATFDPDQTASGSIFNTFGGNPGLMEERADTYTIGFAFTPSAIPGLAIVADYYDIQIKDAIGTTNFRNIIRNCTDATTIDNPFCDAVTRDPNTGLIQGVLATPLNISFSNSRGIDYQVTYTFDLGDVFSGNLGDFTANLGGTYLIEREEQLAAGFPDTVNRLDGETGFPKHFLNVGLSWVKGPWSADYGFNFTSNMVLGNQFGFGREELEANPNLLDRPNTGSAFVHYLGGAYQVNEDFQISLRVNNLFDRDPFELRSGEENFRPVSVLGRTVQLGIQAMF